MDPSPYKPLRIAIDARYVREKPSGIGAYVRALIDRLPALAPGDRFLFWAHPLAAHPLSTAANAREVVVRQGANSPLPVYWPAHYVSFHEVDLFHSPGNMMPRGLPCRTVATVHDVMAIERPDLHLQGIERVAKSLYYQQAVWRALREATRLIAQSKATADRICALLPGAAKRLMVIWSAPDRDLRPPDDMREAQAAAARLTNSDAPYLLLVGANAPNKRHELAVAAFARSVPRPWRLVLVRPHKGSHLLVQLAKRLQIADRLVWLEKLARRDLVTLIQGAGGLVQPSVYEGFGLPVLEAMACGCPVVASDIPAIREVTAGTALLFPAGDREALGSALREFVRSPSLRQSLREQGLARARDFSWDTNAYATLQVYRDAATAGRS